MRHNHPTANRYEIDYTVSINTREEMNMRAKMIVLAKDERDAIKRLKSMYIKGSVKQIHRITKLEPC